MDKRIKDISNQQFGSLTATSFAYTKNRMAYWNYLCKCGNTITTRANTVTHQNKKAESPELPSCGCMQRASVTKHGYRSAKNTHPLYKVWHSIKTRCYDLNSPGYQWYGAKGVTMCSEWKDNPEAFIAWGLANEYAVGLHIDKDILCESLGIRPHVYSPETCQFVSAKTNVGYSCNRNQHGKHPNVKLSHDQVSEILQKYFSGVETNQSQLARDYGLKSPSSIRRLIQAHKVQG